MHGSTFTDGYGPQPLDPQSMPAAHRPAPTVACHTHVPPVRGLKPLCRHCAADGAGAPRANKQTDKKTASSGGERAVRRRMRHRAASHCRAAMSHGILPVASHCRMRSSQDPPAGSGARACAEAACSRLSWPLRSLRAVPSVCSCSASYLPAARSVAPRPRPQHSAGRVRRIDVAGPGGAAGAPEHDARAALIELDELILRAPVLPVGLTPTPTPCERQYRTCRT